jgi:cyclopropane fatty-acyl-phospholipid synthase-like methyltransferase
LAPDLYHHLARLQPEAFQERFSFLFDVEKESESILKSLRLDPGHVVIEFGPGTGAFALAAARRCAKVYAVDISSAMLQYAEQKAAKAGIANIVFRRGGFLTYAHDAPPVDAIVTNTAFHHLPDLWKGIALQRMNGMLRPGGTLYLSDVIFEQRNVRENIERFIAKLGAMAGPEMKKDVEAHVRKEYSTFDWIMDGLFERAGFRIAGKTMQEGVIGRYICRKEKESEI